MPAGQPSVRATSSSTSAGASPRPSRPLRNSLRLGAGEAQLVGAQLEQLAVGAQRARAAAPGRCAWRARAGRRAAGAPTNQATLSRATAPRAGGSRRARARRRPASASAFTSRGSTTSRSGAVAASAASAAWSSAGQARHERLDHVRPQDDRVVVALVQRDPRHRPPRGLLLAPRGEQRRLAEPGRAGDERQLRPRAVAQAREQPLARDRLRGHERRVELGDEQDRRLGTTAGSSTRA